MAEEYSYQVELKGVQQLLSKLSAITRENVIKSSLTNTGTYFVEWIRRNRLSGRPGLIHRTGNLKSRTTSTKAKKSGNAYSVSIGTNVKYGKVHEFGATISPKPPKKFLAWKDRDSGDWIFTRRSVTIPARPFLRPSLENKDNQAYVIKNLKRYIKQELDKK